MIEHIASCPDCRNVIKRLLHEESPSAGKHIDPGMLDRYVIYQHLDEKLAGEDELSSAQVQFIEGHNKECAACRDLFLQKQQDYEGLEKYWEDAILPDFQLNPTMESNTKENILRRFILHFDELKIPRIPLFHRVAISMIIVILFFIFAQFFYKEKSTLEELAQINEVHITYSVRSYTNDLQVGIIAFNKKDFKGAILKFEKYIENSPASEVSNYTTYLLGLSYVMQSNLSSEKENTPNKFLLLSKGINYLSTALMANENGTLHENIMWYLGKAHLMNTDIQSAKEFFEKVKLLNGPKAGAGQDILDKLQDFTN